VARPRGDEISLSAFGNLDAGKRYWPRSTNSAHFCAASMFSDRSLEEVNSGGAGWSVWGGPPPPARQPKRVGSVPLGVAEADDRLPCAPRRLGGFCLGAEWEDTRNESIHFGSGGRPRTDSAGERTNRRQYRAWRRPVAFG